METSGTRDARPRPGRWVAALGLVAALAGTQGSFFTYRLLDEFAPTGPVSERFLGTPYVSCWVLYAIVATLAISLVAALSGATLTSLAGSLLAAGYGQPLRNAFTSSISCSLTLWPRPS